MQSGKWLWFVAGAGVLWAAGGLLFSEAPQAQAQRPAATMSGELIALPFEGADGRQQVTVIDPRTRVMAVYHIDRGTGSLTLRSVRHVQWDLQMEEYNSGSPTPREIRTLLESR